MTLALTDLQWILIVALVAMHLFSALYRVPRWAAATGRNPRLWGAITLFLTVIPATIVHMLDNIRSSHAELGGENPGVEESRKRAENGLPVSGPSSPPQRCPHCGESITPSRRDTPLTCPKCGMIRDESRYA
jgi:hypothetical protein